MASSTLRCVVASCLVAAAHGYSAASLRSSLSLPSVNAASGLPLVRRQHQAATSPVMQAAAAAMPFQPSDELKVPYTNAVSRSITGVLFAFICVTVVTAVYPLVLTGALYGKLFDNKRRRFNDYVVQWWARISMMIFFAAVKVENAEVLPPADEAIMFCPNHCSFLDIFCLSGYMPRRFKYISKIEILRIPMIGWAMGFAKHIAISRMDRASQMKTLKDAVETLKDGNSLVTFPEGTRSKDGRLNEFKKGPFTMASRAGVRIVPLTIIGTHIFQPPGAFVPIAFPRGVRIVCHPPIDSPAPKKEDVAMAQCREAIISALPESMQPLP
jgi:1-acyl-sn-glycerol-3-phosphate acyltransferase